MEILEICADRPRRASEITSRTGVNGPAFYTGIKVLTDKELLNCTISEYTRRWKRKLWWTSEKGLEVAQLWKPLKRLMGIAKKGNSAN
jgi:DNA-binding PadR family transcriptional regulator